MQVLVGLPIYKRDWILPYWFAALEQQDFPLSDLGFMFQIDPTDKKTIDCLLEFSEKHPELWCFDMLPDTQHEHKSHPEPDENGNGQWRQWNHDKYLMMIEMRNNLLNHAVCHDPDRYFSLDSDILLCDPQTINRLIEVTDGEADAASPLLYMYPQGTAFPSVMSWVGAVGDVAYRPRYPIGTTFKADIIMAAVMMTKPVYQTVRYQFHRQGEDLGFSADATTKGFDLYAVTDVYAPHIMSEFHLNYYLKMGDNRGA